MKEISFISKTDDLDDLGTKTDLSIYDNDLVCHITQAMFYKYWYHQGMKWVNMTTCYGNEEKMENMAETEKKMDQRKFTPFTRLNPSKDATSHYFLSI